MPRIIVVDPRARNEVPVAEAVSVLRACGLVALPTETVYGLAARALDEHAIARVFQAKGRPTHHPLIAHVLDEDQARALAASWPTQASILARAFWPGPLTLVVDRALCVPAAIAGGGDSLAVRAPSHAVARAVIALLGEAVAAPSANRYQGLSPTTASHVVKQLGDSVDLVLDAGQCEMGIESTVVDVRGPVARVLRLGAIDLAALRARLPDLDASPERAAAEELRASPGMGARHYAPDVPLVLAASLEEAQRVARALAARGGPIGLVLHQPLGAVSTDALVRQLPARPVEYARLLYCTLHDLQDEGVASIVVQAVPSDDGWEAIADRLRRAATRD